MFRQIILMLGLLAIGFVPLAGCGSKESDKKSVKGRVWYRGEPLPGGTIVFVPDEERGSSGTLVKGAISSDGSFTLNSDMPAGWYRVAIAPLPSPTSSTPTVAHPYPGPPARYRNPHLSGLIGEVKKATDNAFEFQLDDA